MKDITIIIVGIALFAAVWIGWSRFEALRDLRSVGGNHESVFCTADAKLCADGSYVGRVPPDCRFARCPGE
ncbi:MAG: hypothetical protein ACE5F4_01605 [Candidatus Paceibacteria bacterium]